MPIRDNTTRPPFTRRHPYRTNKVQITMSDIELEILGSIADEADDTPTGVVRRFVKDAIESGWPKLLESYKEE